MSTLFLIGLKNFNIYQTTTDMQAAELDTILPGALVYSIEDGTPYYFDNSLANQPSTAFLSDTGEGYWIPYSGDWIFVDGGALYTNIPLDYGTIFVGNINNIAESTPVSGAMTISPTGVTTLSDNVISTNKIVDRAVTSIKIALSTIVSGNIASSTITGSNIASNTITGSNIALRTILGTNIADNTITSDNIANDTIIATNIADGAVTGDKISLDDGNIIVGNGNFGNSVSVTGAISLSNSGVVTINNGSVTTNNIADGAITLNKLASNLQYAYRAIYGFTTTIPGALTVNGVEYSGILATDHIVMTPISLQDNAYAVSLTAVTDGIVIIFNTAPGISSLQFLVFRATS